MSKVGEERRSRAEKESGEDEDNFYLRNFLYFAMKCRVNFYYFDESIVLFQ